MNKSSQLVGICLILVILLDTKALGAALEECEQIEIECTRHRGTTYNCSAPAPIHGDSCTILDTTENLCGDVQNVSANHEVELNWTDSRILMTVEPDTYCNNNGIVLNISCSTNITLIADVSLIPPGVQIREGQGANLHSDTPKNDNIVLVCNATGLSNLETNMKIFGPNSDVWLCPKPPIDSCEFPDAITTGSNQMCTLVVTKVEAHHFGSYYCQVEPVQKETCHDLTSSTIDISANTYRISPDYCAYDYHKGIGIGTGIVACIVIFISIFILIVKRFYKKNLRSDSGENEVLVHAQEQSGRYGGSAIVAEETRRGNIHVESGKDTEEKQQKLNDLNNQSRSDSFTMHASNQ